MPITTVTREHMVEARIDELRPHPKNARKHPSKQVKRLARNMEHFGFIIPIVIDECGLIICGHARVEAAKRLGMSGVPAIRIEDLSEAQVHAFMIADNRLAEMAQWDEPLLAENLKFLSDQDLSFDLEVTGFDYGEIEHRITQIEIVDDGVDDASDDAPDVDDVPAVCQLGDVLRMDEHVLICGDATQNETYGQLFGDERASMVFTDAPYNLAARDIGRVCNSEHGDFAMASGEMSPDQFTALLGSVMGLLCRYSVTGSIHFLFMDWRHAREILSAGLEHYDALKNLCVWVKDRPGMGSFYRSQHELVFVFKNGDTPHQNNFELGQFGRTRSNVWHFPGVRRFDSDDGDPDGDEALKLHPTVKPVKLIEEAVLDCSRRGEIVIDPFLGSGSTLIACEKTRRRCYGIEMAPRYVDVAIQRWQQWTGKEAIHLPTGMTYRQLAAERRVADEKEQRHG